MDFLHPQDGISLDDAKKATVLCQEHLVDHCTEQAAGVDGLLVSHSMRVKNPHLYLNALGSRETLCVQHHFSVLNAPPCLPRTESIGHVYLCECESHCNMVNAWFAATVAHTER